MVKGSNHGMRPFWGRKSLCCVHSFTYASIHTFIYSQASVTRGAALRQRWPDAQSFQLVCQAAALKDSSLAML